MNKPLNKIEKLIAAICPEGVEIKKLGEVAHYPKNRISFDSVDNKNYVGVDNLLQNKQGKTDSNYVPTTGNLIEYKINDILIGNIRPYLKKIWLAANNGGTNGDVVAVRINDGKNKCLIPKFLYYILSSDIFFDYNMQFAKGAKMPRGNKDAILKFPIPIPPLAIQQEIVKILDTFTRLEAELEAELEARKKQYAYYRDELLTFGEDVEWKKLGEVAEFKYGFTDKAKDHGNVRFIRITDINENGKLRDYDSKFLNLKEENKNYLLSQGDILLARTGATYGKTMLFDENYQAIYASFLIRIRFKGKNILSSYYWHFAQSHFYWDQAKKLVGGGAQPQFNAIVLKEIKIPIPPLPEQHRLVAILDKFDALVNDISVGLPAEIKARRKQYEYYRDKLLTFKPLEKDHARQ